LDENTIYVHHRVESIVTSRELIIGILCKIVHDKRNSSRFDSTLEQKIQIKK